MSGDAVPVHPDEFILRRIPETEGHYVMGKTPPVSPGTFRPSSSDTDGLSFYIERETDAATLIDAGKLGKRYAVARFLAKELYSLGLTLIPDQQPDDLPGHVLIPEITLQTYADPKKRPSLKEINDKLSLMASMKLVCFGEGRT